MFTQENLTKIFKGKEFGYGKDFLYFYSEEFDSEEETVSVKILDGIIEITTWIVDDETHKTKDVDSIDYIPFENIKRIGFGKDY